LIARVLSRAPDVRFDDDSAALEISVQVDAKQTNTVVGEVTLSRRGAQPSTRRVAAASCTEASDAIAVIIAIALGKFTSGAEGPAAPERGNTGAPAGTKGGTGASPKNPAASNSADRRRTSEGGAENPDGFSAIPAPSSDSQTRFALQLTGQSFVAPAPGIMFGVGVYAMAGVDRASLWSPSIGLGAARAWRTGVDARGGTASFTLDAVMLDACALRFALASLETRLCASALGGRLTAEGTNTFNTPGAVARPFWVVGGTAMFTANLGARFEISARLAAGVNLVQDEFKFEPAVFHEVPALTFAPSIGFGARFP
jgi:hypothetical protein